MIYFAITSSISEISAQYSYYCLVCRLHSFQHILKFSGVWDHSYSATLLCNYYLSEITAECAIQIFPSGLQTTNELTSNIAVYWYSWFYEVTAVSTVQLLLSGLLCLYVLALFSVVNCYMKHRWVKSAIISAWSVVYIPTNLYSGQ